MERVIPYAVNIYICIFLYIFKVLNMFFKEYSKLVFVTLKKSKKDYDLSFLLGNV